MPAEPRDGEEWTEIKISIRKRYSVWLHSARVLRGKNIGLMIDQALGEYFTKHKDEFQIPKGPE